MNLKRCDRGHFYDADKFVSCPHCAGGMGNSEETVAIHPDDEIKTEALTSPSKFVPAENSVSMTGSLAETVSQVREAFTVDDEDNAVTVSYYETKSGLEPVVGWSA